jgi:hypothetical protein
MLIDMKYIQNACYFVFIFVLVRGTYQLKKDLPSDNFKVFLNSFIGFNREFIVFLLCILISIFSKLQINSLYRINYFSQYAPQKLLFKPH